MFHIVSSANRGLYARQLAAMHAARVRVFAGRRHGGPDAAAGLGSRDRYDDDCALYLMRLDSFGEIVCCGRLRPTSCGSMIAHYFGHAIPKAVHDVARGDAWEFSHYYSRDLAEASMRPSMRAEMRLAILAAALDAGADRILAVIEAEHWSVIEQSGWNVKPLGPPVSYGEGAEAIVYSVSVRPEDLGPFRHRLAEELRLSLGGDAEDAIRLADTLGPETLSLLGSLSRAIAIVEAAEGVDAALALVASLEQAAVGAPAN